MGFLALAVSTNAFNAPFMATRAVTSPKKAGVTNPFAKKAAPATKAKPAAAAAGSTKAPPSSKGYPSFAAQASQYKIKGISGGGNKHQEVFLSLTSLIPKCKKLGILNSTKQLQRLVNLHFHLLDKNTSLMMVLPTLNVNNAQLHHLSLLDQQRVKLMQQLSVTMLKPMISLA